MNNQTYELNNQSNNNLKTFENETNNSYMNKIPNYYNSEQNNVNFYSIQKSIKIQRNFYKYYSQT